MEAGYYTNRNVDQTYRYGYKDDGIHNSVVQIYEIVDNLLLSMFNNKDKIDEFLDCMKDVKQKFGSNANIGVEIDKRKQIDMLLGTSSPIDIEIENPSQANNKGSRKRLRSGKEIIIEKVSKEARRCNRCGKHVYHDARNFPLKKKPENQK